MFDRLLSELRRRHVGRIALVYLVVAWIVVEFADTVLPNLAYQLLEQGGWALGDRSSLELGPLLEPIRADPRWPDLLAKIKNDLDVD